MTPVAAHHVPAMEQHRRLPMRESLGWTAGKHLLQLAFVASVCSFVLRGGDAPFATLAFVGAGLLFMASIAIIDRDRFLLRDTRFEVVAAVAPSAAPMYAYVPAAMPMHAMQQPQVPLRLEVT